MSDISFLVLATVQLQCSQVLADKQAIEALAQEIATEPDDVNVEPTPLHKPSLSTPLVVSERSGENAVQEAEDAFGYIVGRESLGIYSVSNVRGFSPFAAGNVRIEGLYFDPFPTLLPRLRRSTAIRVGLAAQGYSFLSPTGIVDYSFRKPQEKSSLAVLASSDSYGSVGIEADAVLPVSDTLSIGLGGQIARNSYAARTDNFNHNQALALRWQPSPNIEIVPFWQRDDVSDGEARPIYIPEGPFLPPRIPRRQYDGPVWTDYNGIAGLHGVLVTASPASGWTVRGGLFRSLYDDRSFFAHLLTGLTPDGTANRIIIADPPSRFVSISGELRISRALAEGPRLHTFHLSYRGRNRRQRYAGSDVINFGSTTIGERFEPTEPNFEFTEQTRDVVSQSLYGIAYEGRWRGLGELSFSLSYTDYTKTFELPEAPTLETRSSPLVYNVRATIELNPRLVVYAGHARGLEEAGVAPNQAVNRNQPLPALITQQLDGGLRYRLTDELNLIIGAFELRKPYFSLDGDNVFRTLGETLNRGIEFSVAGALTPSLNLVGGAVLLQPRVVGAEDALAEIGSRPVGLSSRLFELNLDWRLPLSGVSLDASVSHSGEIPALVNNSVSIPPRTLVNLGARYRFRAWGDNATLRMQVLNAGNVYGYNLRGAGAYEFIPGRRLSAYLTVDF